MAGRQWFEGGPPCVCCVVANPEEFISRRKETVIVVIDETAIWLKLRGEEKIYISEAEVRSARARKAFKKIVMPTHCGYS